MLKILLLCIALNLGLFFLLFAVGTQNRNPAVIPFVAFFAALFQCAVPYLGAYIGGLLGKILSDFAIFFGALILIFFGYQLIKTALRFPYRNALVKNVPLICFALILENFLAGIRLAVDKQDMILFTAVFFVITYPLNLGGLKLGRAARGFVRFSVDTLIGFVLIIMGLLNLLHAF